MTLIGICGKMGSGKDFLASNVIIPFIEGVLKQKCLKLSLADQIKVNVMTKNNIKFEDVFVEKTSETRRMLQREGTELGRDKLGKDIWINYLYNWSRVFESRGIDHIVTCDVRFRNEMIFIKRNNGILIKVVSPNRNHKRLMQESRGHLGTMNSLANHVSECDLDEVALDNFDVVVNNDVDDINENEDVDRLRQVLFEHLSRY